MNRLTNPSIATLVAVLAALTGSDGANRAVMLCRLRRAAHLRHPPKDPMPAQSETTAPAEVGDSGAGRQSTGDPADPCELVARDDIKEITGVELPEYFAKPGWIDLHRHRPRLS